MLRLALVYVRDRAAAEEVVQDAWIGVLEGIGRFEGRSSLKTWVFRILTNRAMTSGVREHRSVPFSALDESGDSAVGARALPAGKRRLGRALGGSAQTPRSRGAVAGGRDTRAARAGDQ